MTIALIDPSGGYIGQGHSVSFSSSLAVAGGTATYSLYDPLLAFPVTAGDTSTSGPGPYAVRLGMIGGGLAAFVQGLPPGNALTVRIRVVDAVHALLEQADFASAFFHDPSSGLGGLVGLGTYHDPVLDDIIAAVRRQY